MDELDETIRILERACEDTPADVRGVALWDQFLAAVRDMEPKQRETYIRKRCRRAGVLEADFYEWLKERTGIAPVAP